MVLFMIVRYVFINFDLKTTNAWTVKIGEGSGPRGTLPEIGVHYLVLFSWEILEGHHQC